MKRTGCFLLCFLLGCFSFVFSQSVNIVYDKASPQAKYAAVMLGKTLTVNGYTLNATKAGIVITLSSNGKRIKEEAYTIRTNGKTIAIIGGDNRGMIYGS